MDKPIPEAVRVLHELRAPYVCMADSHEGEASGDDFKRIVRGLDVAIKALTAAQQQGQAVGDHVRRLVGKLDQWRLCMSHNDSYFGEPAGLVKSVSLELARAVDPIYPPKPEPVDPLAGVTVRTATVPLSPLAHSRCGCDPSGVDGLTCPDATGKPLCCTAEAQPMQQGGGEVEPADKIERLAMCDFFATKGPAETPWEDLPESVRQYFRCAAEKAENRRAAALWPAGRRKAAPPSAPVGVEGLVVAARKLRDSARGMDDGNRWVPGAVFKQFSKAVTAALATQHQEPTT